MLVSRLTKVMAVFVLGCVGARAQSPSPAQLPTTEQVLDRYVQATGGEDAVLRHKSMTVHRRYQVPGAKVDLELVVYTKDGKLLEKIKMPSGKEYATGYDGQTAWRIDADGKVTLYEGDEVLSFARDADMYYHLHVMKYFRSLDVVGVQEFDGRPCYHLKGVNNWGKVNEHFYDTETGLLLGYAYNTAWRGGRGEATTTFEDYKDFGGVRMPAQTTTREGDEVSVSLITSVTYDDVADSVFALPDAVKSAVAASKSGGKS